MKVLICGDREWTEVTKISDRIATLPMDAIIIHGAASGADSIAGQVAKSRGRIVQAFPADWIKHGISAGPIRNRQMLDEKPDLVIAFHSNIEASKGTKDCVTEARRRGIPVEVIS